MTINLKPETESLIEVVLRPHFGITFAAATCISLFSLYYIEKQQLAQTETADFVYPNLMANVVTLSVFLGAMMYAKSPEITRSVARGVIPPLKLSRLKALPFPISTICGSEGDRTLKDFLLYVAAFPGVTVGVVMYIMCIVVTGDLSFHWSVPTQTYLAMTSLWRLVVAASIFTMNYIAALNPSQTIFIPTPDSDAVQETAKTK